MNHSTARAQNGHDATSQRYGGFSNTFDMITAGAKRVPDAPALSFFLDVKDHKRPFQWTHGQAGREIIRAANVFHRHGLARNDVVAMVLPNVPEAYWTIWGGEAAAIVMPVNPLLEPSTLAALLKAANARAIVTLGPTPNTDLWEKVQSLLPQVPSIKTVFTVNVLSYYRGLLGPALKMRAALRTPRAVEGAQVFDLHKEMRAAPDQGLLASPPQLDDVASYFCTGGTTGLPKIAVRTHRTEVANSCMVAEVLGDDLKPGAVAFCGLPLFHVNAQLGSGLIPWSKGAHVVLGTPQGYRGRDVIKRFWELVEHHRIETFSGVPTVYSTLMKVPLNGHDVRSLKVGICGAAPLAKQTLTQFESATGIKILEGYGLTEAGCVSTLNRLEASKVGSIGICVPGQELRSLILDEDGRYVRDAAVDEVGVLAVHGPNTFAGYLDPVHDRGLWILRPEPYSGRTQTWLNTGDLGRIDRDGFVFLTGRKKELIIRGGHNIDPRTIEEALHAHPAVALAAAIGRPDAHAGEVPVAYVQLHPNMAVTDSELEKFAESRIGERAAVPKKVRVLETLPTTAIGKVFKPAILMMEIEDVVRTEAQRAHVALLSVKVAQDARRGFVVSYDAHDPSGALRDALAHYTFASEAVSLKAAA